MPGHLSGRSIHILNEAALDSGYPHLKAGRDLPMLLSFLDRFDHLGWFPPIDLEKRRILAAHDVIMHVVRHNLCFYEFCSKGARGERDPWLSIFFHVDASWQIRICGIELTEVVRRRRALVLERIRLRVVVLDESLRRRKGK